MPNMSLNAQYKTTNRDENILKIWQQNINKSSACQHDLISNDRLIRDGIDIIALQEPSINQFGGIVNAREWTAVYPTTHTAEPHKTHSLLLICTNLLTNKWEQINMKSGDMTVIKVKSNWGTLTIYNIYNDCKHDRTLDLLAESHRQYQEENSTHPREQEHLMWLGDFNRHHPHWDMPSDTRLFTTEALMRAEKLIGLVASAGLDLVLLPRTPTHCHNVTKKWTRLDDKLRLCTEEARCFTD